jgi:hypothetical protein
LLWELFFDQVGRNDRRYPKLIAAQPFVPFTIHSAEGVELTVPTVDHVAVPPAGGRVFVFPGRRKL